MATPIRLCAFLFAGIFFSQPRGWSEAKPSSHFFVYFGTYTGFEYVGIEGLTEGKSLSKGIYVSRFDADTGQIGAPELAANIVNPSFLAVSPDRRFLYAVTEDPLSLGPDFDHESFVSAFAINAETGKLRLLNTVPAGGTSTCYLSLDKTGRYLLLANFGSSAVTVLRVRPDGFLGEETAYIKHVGHGKDWSFQSKAHPHSIDVSPDNRYAIVSDLGTDKVYIYRFDASTGALSPPAAPYVQSTPGGGPRHFTFDAAGRFGYSLNELSGIVSVFAWNPSAGTLTRVQDASTIPADFIGRNDSAEIQIHPNGRFLYETNRRSRGPDWWGPDSIGVFAIDPAKGTLSEVEQEPTEGHVPRSFGIDPTGSYLFAANEVSGSVTLYRVNAETGRLTPTGTSLKMDVPVCIKFVPRH